MCQAGFFFGSLEHWQYDQKNLMFLTSRPPWFKLANSAFLFAHSSCVLPLLHIPFSKCWFLSTENHSWLQLCCMCVADTDFFLQNSRLHDEARDDTCATPMMRFLWHSLRFGCIYELFLLCLKGLFLLGCSIVLENSFHSRAFNRSAKEMCKSLNHIKTLFW